MHFIGPRACLMSSWEMIDYHSFRTSTSKDPWTFRLDLLIDFQSRINHVSFITRAVDIFPNTISFVETISPSDRRTSSGMPAGRLPGDLSADFFWGDAEAEAPSHKLGSGRGVGAPPRKTWSPQPDIKLTGRFAA